jgi:hypothetical protein
LFSLKNSSSLFNHQTEVESSYEKALEEEEERVTYQRKMLLLSIKTIRERENEMLIQGRNCLMRKRVEASESELESMLRHMEKQVEFSQKHFHASFAFFPPPDLLCSSEYLQTFV